jgi:hypothetical protein
MQGLTDQGIRISLLWITVMFNMVFADVLSLFSPGFLAEVIGGHAEGVQITDRLLLVAALFIEVPVLMIVLTHVLPHRASCIANIGAAIVTITFVIAGGSWKPHYVFFATVETLALLAIIHLAITWRPERASPG